MGYASARLEQGIPTILVLVHTKMKGGRDECANLSHNHQVLAVGYRDFEKHEHVDQDL